MARPIMLRSTFTGAPVLNGLVGQGIQPILNACLINGFNIKTLTSLTQTGGTATATVTTGHGYDDDTLIRISGANESDFNGDFRITVTGSSTFTFPISTSAPSTASGTLSAKYAPLDWEAAFTSSDNTRTVYRSKDVTSRRFYLRCLDNHDNPTQDANYGNSYKTATMTMYETMSDVDTGTGATKSYWRRAQSLNANARPWVLIGDSKRFWLITAWSESYTYCYCPHYFGDFFTFKPGDNFNVMLAGAFGLAYDAYGSQSSYNTGYINTVWTGVGANNGMWVARPYFALGGSVNVHWIGPYTGWIGRHAGTTFPNPCDGGMFLFPPLLIQEGGAFPTIRGILPGLLCPMNLWPVDANKQYTEMYEGFIINGLPRKMLCLRGSYQDGGDRLAFDLTGPWD